MKILKVRQNVSDLSVPEFNLCAEDLNLFPDFFFFKAFLWTSTTVIHPRVFLKKKKNDKNKSNITQNTENKQKVV